MPAQDTIYKRNGELLSAKILEISASEIKYKRFDMQDGPLFVSGTNEIKKIKFSNGAIDSFQVAKPVTQPTSVSNPVIIAQHQANDPQKDLMIQNARGGSFYYKNNYLSEKRMLFVAAEKNRTWKNKELDKAILATRDYKSNQYISGFGGAGLAIACILAAGSTANTNSNSTTSIALSFNAIGIFIASQIVSPMFKRKRTQSAAKVAKLFNEETLK